MANVDMLIKKARKTNKERDRIDEFPPKMISVESIIATAKEALKCSMSIEDWNIVAEAYALLEEAEELLPNSVPPIRQLLLDEVKDGLINEKEFIKCQLKKD